MAGILLETVELQGGTSSDFGIQIDHSSGERPRISLFEIKENSGAILSQNLFDILPALRDRHFPGTALSEIDFDLTNGFSKSSISVSEIEGGVTRLDFESGYIDGRMRFDTIESYNQALLSLDGFESAITEGRGFNSAQPRSFLSIDLPSHAQGRYFMETLHSTGANANTELIFVDAEAFVADWRATELGNQGNAHPDAYLFNSDLETASRNMWSDNFDPDVMHSVSELGTGDELRFINGRHRAANLATLGARVIPVEVDRSYAETVRERYEFSGEKRASLSTRSEIELDAGANRGILSRTSEVLADAGRNAGFLGGILIGTAAGATTLLASGSIAEAAEVGFEIVVPYGETALDLAEGDVDAAMQSATVETAATLGGLGGAVAGAATGALIGSAVPIIGTTVGAVAGGILGSFGFGVAAGETTEYLLSRTSSSPDPETQVFARGVDRQGENSAAPEIIAGEFNFSSFDFSQGAGGIVSFFVEALENFVGNISTAFNSNANASPQVLASAATNTPHAPSRSNDNTLTI